METQPFTWGSNGSRMTAEDIAAQRKVAQALIDQGTDSSPLPAGTRGAGVWAQGLARVAKGLLGGYESAQASKAADANAADNTAMIAKMVGGAPAAASTAPVATAAPAATLDPETTGYINNAATKFGVDPEYLKKTALIESGGNPNAQNPSGAAGLYQFMPKTAKAYGLDNPLDPEDSAMAAAELAADNKKALATSLGRDPTNGELYLAHQQGAGGASALLANPNAPAIQAVGRQAVLQNGGTEDMTAGQFARKWTDKFAPAPVQMASNDPTAVPAAAAPAAVTPGVAKVSSALPGVNPAVFQAATSPYADSSTKQIAGILLAQQLGKEKKDTYSQQTDADGNIWSVNNATGQRTVAKAADKSPAAVQEFEYGQTHPDFVTQQLAKTKAGAAQLNNTNNVDTNSGQTYDKQLAEGLAKSHAALANGVEDAQTRARDIAGMQGAIDAIQKNGGTTGGMGQAQILELKKTLNSGATSLGMGQPFDENSLSDAELMQKLNRQMAGAQAKNAVGARVTNFDMQNYLAANPGLSLSPTANQRLLGVQAQVEQRNIAVGNAIRDATAQSISQGKKIDPVTVQGIITDYDKAHHVQDPVTGQDLTQSYALPEFQSQGSNPALAVGHEANIGNIKIKRIN